MKILLVTPLFEPWDPHWFWFKALKALGHRVKIFKLAGSPRIKLIKTWQLKKLMLDFKPDEIFFSGGLDAVFPINHTVFFTGVAPRTLSAGERRIGIQAKLVIVNEPAHIPLWQQLGAKKTICLPISAIDPDYFKPAKAARTILVSFVGTLFPYRQQQLAKLVKLCPKIKIWGRLEPGTALQDQLKPYYQGLASGSQVARIYQKSLIGLNLAPGHLPLAGNLRTFEIPGCGAMLLSDKLNPDWYVPGVEAVSFSGPQSGAQKIKYYLAQSQARQVVALSGWRRTIKAHTYRQRFCLLFKDYL